MLGMGSCWALVPLQLKNTQLNYLGCLIPKQALEAAVPERGRMLPFQKRLKQLLNGYNFYQELFRDKCALSYLVIQESLCAKGLGAHLGLCQGPGAGRGLWVSRRI